MTHMTTDQMKRVMNKYFAPVPITFETRETTYEQREQTQAILLVKTGEYDLSTVYDLGFATTIEMHGYWEGRMKGHQWSQYDTSEQASVYLVDGTRTIKTMQPETPEKMLKALPDFIPKLTPQEPSEMQYPTDNKGWAKVLKRLAKILEESSSEAS